MTEAIEPSSEEILSRIARQEPTALAALYKSRARRAVGVSFLVLIGLVGTRTRPTYAAALPACTGNDVSAQDSGCPVGSGPCTISKVFAVGDGCVLDFDTRAVTIASGGELDIGSGAVVLYAASLTLAAGSAIDGQGTGATLPTSPSTRRATSSWIELREGPAGSTSLPTSVRAPC